MTTSPANQASHTLALSEPTIRDLDLAERLGYERPTSIRQLIKRNLPMLEALGTIATAVEMVGIGSGAKRAVTAYQLTKSQAIFITGKSGTKRADSLAALNAELLVMVSDGRLAPVDSSVAAEAQAAVDRERARRAAINAEERDARSDAFLMLSRGRSYGPRGREAAKAKPRR